MAHKVNRDAVRWENKANKVNVDAKDESVHKVIKERVEKKALAVIRVHLAIRENKVKSETMVLLANKACKVIVESKEFSVNRDNAERKESAGHKDYVENKAHRAVLESKVAAVNKDPWEFKAK